MNSSTTILLAALALAIVMLLTVGCAQKRDDTDFNIREQEALAWHQSLDSAMTEARERRTLIVVDVYTNRPGW
jgi:hypothetical protein